MDEDLGVKVTVTRLTRRLSVEAEASTQSPSTPSTPTKKRGGRLAAKPQLELIDEVSENIPKRTTRKSIARDVEPSEDKGVTPSRRSARIRSNTSLLADTPKMTDSPRAKRAARRNSLLESDTDTPVAPVRQTRRTRKDSAASVDIAENEKEPPNTKQTVKNTDANTKDQEDNDTGTPSPRRSPRLQNNDKKSPPKRRGRSSKKSFNTSLSQDTQPSEAVNNVTPEKNDLNNSAKRLSVSNARLSTDAINTSGTKEEANNDNKNETLKLTQQDLNDINSIKNSGYSLNISLRKESEKSNLEDTDQDPNLKAHVNTHGDALKKSDAEILLEKDPITNIQPVVLIEDSDSNCGSGKLVMDIGDDQCVPVVINQFVKDPPKNSDVEPMDIDETIPDNITINDYIDPGNLSKEATVPSNNSQTNDLINNCSILSISLSKDTETINPQETISSTDNNNISKNVTSNKLDCEGDKNTSLNQSSNKRTSSISISPESDNLTDVIQSNKSKRKSSTSSVLNDSNSNVNKSRYDSPSKQVESNKEFINLNTSSNKFQINCSLQLGDDDSKKNSSSVFSADIEGNSQTTLNKSKRKSSLLDSNNSKLLQSPKNSNNDNSKNKSRNSNQYNNEIKESLDSNENLQNSTGKNNQSRRKSSINVANESNIEEINSKDIDKNKTNATIVQADSQNLEKSTNENKSTLVLSQLKDISTNDTKNESNNDVSRSNLTSDVAKKSKKNIIENYSTSTPLQQKSMQKLGMQINTSIISPSVTNKSVDVKSGKVSKASLIASDSSDEEQEDYVKSGKVSKASLIASDSSDDEQEDYVKSGKVSKASLIASDSSDEEKEDATKNRNKIVDDEASEASDDYESGDSRDYDEKQYEEENEIREKGETLESEQDFSNDSDYEKDSFIVSSDEEDNEMLSGTGDDLSLSDRELTMNKKSKKKFNERKLKEQKKASREMYEARHNINKSKEGTKTKSNKKSKTKHLDSSSSESDVEDHKPKKNNRQRIDSSCEVRVCKSDADESIGIKKKKIKRLSESVCEESAIVSNKSNHEESLTQKRRSKHLTETNEDTAVANEKEITICNESAINNKDPLIDAIKTEPKTPQKDFNISTVPIVDNMEEVHVDTNMSVINTNETSDPLQTTMAQDDDSLSSENMEIVNSYDSVLNNLNDQRKIKNLDMSLNTNKKSNAKSKEPIIDQLNLTHTKKNEKNNVKKSQKNTSKTASKVEKDESDSSDSIDMQLLFPEDSNDSEVNTNKVSQSKKEIEPAEEYIPLKKTPGKTNIHEKFDISASLNNSGLNKSKSNAKEKSSLLLDETETSSEPIDDDIKIFIDTTGTLDLDFESTKTNSSKKKKKKSLNNSGANDSISENTDAQNVTINNVEMEPPLEVLFKSDKKKKNKNKSFDETSITYTDTETNEMNVKNALSNNFTEINVTENKFTTETPKSEKKKKNKNNDISILDQSASDDSSAKKKAKKSNQGLFEDIVENTELDTSHKSEKKKKKNKSINVSTTEDNVTGNNDTKSTSLIDLIFDDVELNTSNKSEKKTKKNKSINVSTIEDNVTGNNDTKSTSIIETIGLMFEDVAPNISLDTSLKSEKKKKKDSNVSVTENIEAEIPSAKKKSKKLSKSLDGDTSEFVAETKVPELMMSESLSNSSKKKKNKHNNSIVEPKTNEETEGNPDSGKKKRNKSINSISDDNAQELETVPQTLDLEINNESVADPDPTLNTSQKSKKKKKKNRSVDENVEIDVENKTLTENVDIPTEDPETSVNTTQKSKKKKKKNKSVDENVEIDVNNKISTENVADVPTEEPTTESLNDNSSIKSKKKKKHANNEQSGKEIVEQVITKSTAIQLIGGLNHDDDAPEEVSIKYEKANTGGPNNQKTMKRKLESENSQDAVSVTESKKKRKLAKMEGISNKEDCNNKFSKKRKRSDGGLEEQPPKVFKENSLDNIHVSRLPTSILDKLNDKPQLTKRPKAIATSNFIVEDARTRKNKPSTYLEQSVYLNDTPKKNKKKNKNKEIPIVLPFIPTAETSDQGYTSKFRINVLPQETQFVAQTSNITNFKNELLTKNRIKKMGTFEKFKSQRSRKLCKF